MGGGRPLRLRGYGGPPPGNFENFNSIWCTLVKFGGSFMQKETTIKEKKLYMHRHFVSYHPLILGLLYLIVPFWYASEAYQASLVEPWFVFWRDAVEPKYPWRDQTSLICGRSVPKKVRLGIYRTQRNPVLFFQLP